MAIWRRFEKLGDYAKPAAKQRVTTLFNDDKIKIASIKGMVSMGRLPSHSAEIFFRKKLSCRYVDTLFLRDESNHSIDD